MRSQLAIVAEVDKSLSDVYGTVNSYEANAGVVLWAIERLSDVEEAKVGIRKINRQRRKLGLVGVFVPFGHKFF